MKKLVNLIILSFITFTTIISCSTDDKMSEVKTLKLKFPKMGVKALKNGKPTNLLIGFSTYSISIDAEGNLTTNDSNLRISKGVNKENGIMSYIVTEKSKKSQTTLKSLQLSASTNSESNGGAGTTTGYWWDGRDCFIWGTILTNENGDRLFFPADPATQFLYNRCGYSNMG